MLGDDELRDEGSESGAFEGEPIESHAETPEPIADGGAPDAALPPIEGSGAAPSEGGDPANLQTSILSEGNEADGDILESAPPPSLDQLAPEATLTINAHADGESPTSLLSPAETVSPVYGNTISPAPAAPIGSGSHSYLLPLEPESRPSGPDELLQHLPERATPRLSSPRAAQPVPNAAGVTGGKPLPRVMVMVTLADAKADTNDLLEADGRRMAPQYQQIAKSEIEQERDLQKSLQRAADYRLRGPR